MDSVITDSANKNSAKRWCNYLFRAKKQHWKSSDNVRETPRKN